MLPINYKALNTSPPVAIIDNASASTTEIDTQGFDYCIVFCWLGATDIAMTSLQCTESDTAGSGHAAVTGLVYGTSSSITGSTSSLPAADEDNGIFAFEIDLLGRKRYLDVTATCGNGDAGTFVTVNAILLRAQDAPDANSATERGLTGCLRV